MAEQTVMLSVSEQLYRRLQQRAEQANRSIEDEMLELIATAMPTSDELPPELLAELASLSSLSDSALWRLARSRFPIDLSLELEALNHQRQRGELAQDEEQRASELMRQWDRWVGVRAEAAFQLKRRGNDVAGLIAPV